MRRPVFAALVLAVCFGCGGPAFETGARAFSPSFPADNGASIARVRARVAKTPIPRGPDVAVGIAEDRNSVSAVLLDGTQHAWAYAHRVDELLVTGDVAVASGDGEAVVIDLRTGRPVARRKIGPVRLVGAADDGTMTVLTLRRGGIGGSSVMVFDRGGTVLRRIESDESLGAPALVGGVVFVPWKTQYVSAIEVTTGEELGRFASPVVTESAFTSNGSIFFGDQELVRFDDAISAPRPTRFALPPHAFLGETRRAVPESAVPLETPDANRPARLLLKAAPDPGVGFEDNVYYTINYGALTAVDVGSGHPLWSVLPGAEAAGGGAYHGGAYFCDVDGRIFRVALDGAVSQAGRFNRPLRTCLVRSDAVVTAPPRRPDPTTKNFSSVLLSSRPELLPLQLLLLDALGKFGTDEATQVLLDIAEAPKKMKDVNDRARTVIASLRTGRTAMVTRLGNHADFLAEHPAPAVGPMADALATMGAREAAPELARHLLDPATAEEDLPAVARALRTLAGANELLKLRQFFALYRVAARGPHQEAACAIAGEALARQGSPEDVARIDKAQNDVSTNAEVRRLLAEALAKAPRNVPNPSRTPP